MILLFGGEVKLVVDTNHEFKYPYVVIGSLFLISIAFAEFKNRIKNNS